MPPVVHVSEYDIGRSYTVGLIGENNDTFTIPTGMTATIEGTLNGVVGFSVPATISNNKVAFTLTESMTAYAGKAWCKIKLTLNDEPIQTCAFILAVDRAGVESETVIGAPGFEEQIKYAVDEWLNEHGGALPPGGKAGQVLVSDGQGGGNWATWSDTSGLTTAQVNALDGMFKVCAFIKADVSAEYTAFKTAFGIADSGGGDGDPDKPVTPEVTLTSISATYSGVSVPAGTALDALTGIVVTAQYSDGSTTTVTGYTLSGTIAEGSNTITVSYGGMTTTFSVTGIAESGGNGNEPPFDNITWADGTRISGAGKEYTGHTTYSTMDYVNVIGINAITIEISDPWQGNAQYIYEFYDADKAFVSGGPSNNSYISATNATYPKSVTIEVPENVIYCRLCGTRVRRYNSDGTLNQDVSFFEAVKITVS